MLYILAGPDDFSLTRSLQEIKSRLGDATVLATCTTVLEGQKVTLDEIRNACQTIPFLAEKRLVIIEALIERFESGARTERPTRQPRRAAAGRAPICELSRHHAGNHGCRPG